MNLYIDYTSARGTSCKPGLRLFPVFVLSGPVMDGPRSAGRAHFPLSSWSLRESHRRQVVPGLLFFSCCLQENRGTEWVEPQARSLIAAGRLAMLAALRGDSGAISRPKGRGPCDARAHPRAHQDHAS